MASLFTPYKLKSINFKNRIAVPPMCQYVADEGKVTDWHRVHYAALARGGAGLVIVEASSVSREGRITPGDVGIWNDELGEALAPIAQSIKANGAVAGIQLAHAGRKASANRPWEGDDHMPETDPRAWETLAASAVPLGAGLAKVPRALTKPEIARIQQDFVDGAKRALAAGYEWLELHFAHGYLAMNFLSPHSNHRTDEYGGSAENRARFLVETVDAVRAVWPDNLPLAVRLGILEFDDQDEQTLKESVNVARKLKDAGVDFIDVSLGFSTIDSHIPWGTPAFMVPYAKRFRDEVGIAIAASWGIDTPELANSAIEREELDLVMVGKAHLANPNWPYYAARQLSVERPSWTLPAPHAHWLERYAVGS
jgi:NADPH2 dehydrogenase